MTTAGLIAKRRKDVLRLWFRGYTTDQIAEALGWSTVVIGKDIRKNQNISRELDAIGRRKIISDFMNEYEVRKRELTKILDKSQDDKVKLTALRALNDANRDFYNYIGKIYGLEAPQQIAMDLTQHTLDPQNILKLTEEARMELNKDGTVNSITSSRSVQGTVEDSECKGTN